MAFMLQGLAGQTYLVHSVEAWSEALSKVRRGDTLVVADGVYADFEMSLRSSGKSDQPIIIRAQNLGKVIISGDSSIRIYGDHIQFSGFYFKDGKRNPDEWASHGPGLLTVYGSHVRITECAFHQFDTANGGWITVMPSPSGVSPQFVRIDHCSFTNKVSRDQVINLNNCDRRLWSATYDQKDGAKGAPPMYHRIDHCYFSNPPKVGNAGAAIRVGTWRNDSGRCVIDNNLFERQDSEPEIITSKSRENIYYNNTFLNCRGTMNFRHGDSQYLVGNCFLGTDSLYGYGGVFVWGEEHLILKNYMYLPRTLKNRGEACIYLNAGVPKSEHARADKNIIASNTLITEKGRPLDLSALLERRLKQIGTGELGELLPRGNAICDNIFAVLDSSYRAFEAIDAQLNSRKFQYWKGNVLMSPDGEDSQQKGIVVSEFSLVPDARGLLIPSVSKQAGCGDLLSRIKFDKRLPVNPVDLAKGELALLENSPRMDFSNLLSEESLLSFQDVGPSWLGQNPSDYASSGKVSPHLREMLEKAHNSK